MVVDHQASSYLEVLVVGSPSSLDVVDHLDSSSQEVQKEDPSFLVEVVDHLVSSYLVVQAVGNPSFLVVQAAENPSFLEDQAENPSFLDQVVDLSLIHI